MEKFGQLVLALHENSALQKDCYILIIKSVLFSIYLDHDGFILCGPPSSILQNIIWKKKHCSLIDALAPQIIV